MLTTVQMSPWVFPQNVILGGAQITVYANGKIGGSYVELAKFQRELENVERNGDMTSQMLLAFLAVAIRAELAERRRKHR